MHIGGFQKLTLLDYPGQVACILFTAGCNFRCPYCHNAGLVVGAEAAPEESETEIFEYLKRRQGLLDGVVISGGEPFIQPDLEELAANIHALGYRLKLDTNGSFPERLLGLLDEGLLDYVAMDVKHSPEKYETAIGREDEGVLKRIEESMKILRTSGIDFEFRTTLVRGIHEEEDVNSIARWIAGPEPYYLQSYVDSGNVLNPERLGAFSPETLKQMETAAKQYCPNTSLRGV